MLKFSKDNFSGVSTNSYRFVALILHIYLNMGSIKTSNCIHSSWVPKKWRPAFYRSSI